MDSLCSSACRSTLRKIFSWNPHCGSDLTGFASPYYSCKHDDYIEVEKKEWQRVHFINIAEIQEPIPRVGIRYSQAMLGISSFQSLVRNAK